MRDVIVLLPGITGSVLRKGGRVVWGWSGAAMLKSMLTRGEAMVDALSLTDDPPGDDDLGDGVTADQLIPDLHIFPGLWKVDGYTKVADEIRARFAVAPGRNFFEFPYDWRRDNRVAARILARRSHDWLESWRSTSGNRDAKLILVAHSMGGLVSRYFLEVLEGWKYTRALITFGTPYRGSLNALDALANGLTKGPLGMMELSRLARTLTSIYQLLPLYECYDPGDGTLVRVGETSGIPNVDSERAAAALAFHREIENAVAAHERDSAYVEGGYDIFPVVGIGQPTYQSARRSTNGVELSRALAGKDTPGDGTVPFISAVPIEKSERPNAMYAAQRHASLQNTDAVLAHLEGIITSSSTPFARYRKTETSQGSRNVGPHWESRSPSSYTPLDAYREDKTVPVSLDVDDVYTADEPVTARLMLGARARVSHAVLVHVDTGETSEVALRGMTAGPHTLELGKRATGAYRLTISGENRIAPVTDIFAVV